MFLLLLSKYRKSFHIVSYWFNKYDVFSINKQILLAENRQAKFDQFDSP